jgi:outer membrane lipoprotein-sorting protein
MNIINIHLKHKITGYLLLAGLSLLTSNTVLAITPEQKGLQIAHEMDKRDSGWRNYSADLKMVLMNKNKDKSIRKIKTKMLEVKNDGDKSLMLFQAPADVRNTVFLSVSHKSGPDDQWLYLPALKRVKRISSSSKGGAFMGSEFSYEDMSSQEPEKYNFRYLRDDKYKGRDVYVVERTPKDKHSIYSKNILWVDKKYFINWKIEYFNRRGTHLKTLSFLKYKRFLKKYWRSRKMYMVNHRSKKSTILGWSSFKFRSKITNRDFNPRNLSHF